MYTQILAEQIIKLPTRTVKVVVGNYSCGGDISLCFSVLDEDGKEIRCEIDSHRNPLFPATAAEAGHNLVMLINRQRAGEIVRPYEAQMCLL